MLRKEQISRRKAAHRAKGHVVIKLNPCITRFVFGNFYYNICTISSIVLRLSEFIVNILSSKNRSSRRYKVYEWGMGMAINIKMVLLGKWMEHTQPFFSLVLGR